MIIIQGKPLKGYSRGKRATTQIVLHESCTNTALDAYNVLVARDLGLHAMVDRNSLVYQHLDWSKAAAHAEGFKSKVPSHHNEDSIGIEVAGRYYGTSLPKAQKLAPAFYADAMVIKTCWADRIFRKGQNGEPDKFINPERLYIMPTQGQLESTWELVNHVINLPGVDVPMLFPANRWVGTDFVFNWSAWPQHEGARGIMAHSRWDHADGKVPECYLAARSLGLEPADAYSATVAAASSMRKNTVISKH